jgi:NADPH-dependent glutamate synthase beta subunit-like oxidoreductase
MSSPDLGELQSILVAATRCLDCRDPRCVNLCPEHVDVPAAMRLIVSRGRTAPSSHWMQHADEATASVLSAIERSFE